MSDQIIWSYESRRKVRWNNSQHVGLWEGGGGLLAHLSHFWANGFPTLKVPKTCDPILVTLLKTLEKTTPL